MEGNFQNNPQMNRPDNNLVWAILCTALCCMPLGVVAILKSTQVDKLWAEGRYDEAQKTSADVMKFVYIGAGVGFVVIILSIIFNVLLQLY